MQWLKTTNCWKVLVFSMEEDKCRFTRETKWGNTVSPGKKISRSFRITVDLSGVRTLPSVRWIYFSYKMYISRTYCNPRAMSYELSLHPLSYVLS